MDRLLRVLFFLFALLAYVNGVTYVVNTVNDVVAADGVMSLREALNAATLNVASFEAPAGSPTLNDDIILPAGTFTITGADLPILTGGPGTITGAAGLATIISGANTFRPFWVGTNSWSISSLIITNGRATGVNAQFINGTSTSGTGGGGGGGGLGGGIYISGAATLNLIGVIVQNNIAEGGNGSAGVNGPVGGVNVTGVGGNTDPLGKGVGGNGGTATLNCTAGTYASGGGGGAAGAVGCAAGTFGGAGGAGLAGASGFGGPGGGGGGLGGGIYVEGGATLSITTTSVVLNAALGGVGFLPGLGKGGGIFLEAGSTFTSTASCIQLNTAENPAGIATDNNDNFGTVPADPAPTLVLPANATVQCRTSTLPAVTGTAQPFDNCPIAPATFTDVTVTGSCPQNLIVTRTWRATDSVGQNVTGNQQILLVDTTAPVLTPPAAATIPCGTSPVPANTGGLAVAVDNCDAAPVVTFSDVTNPGLCPQAPVITRTFNATDACGNVAVPVTQTITFIDNIAPTLVIPANVSIPCTVPPTTANTGGNATATDNCDLAPVVSFTDTLVPGGCVSNFTILRTWSARDACGNVATRVQGIVVFDNIPPVLTPPANVIVGCNVVPGDNTTGAATAVDSCAAPITLTSTLVDILPCSFARNFRAVDQCGNVATATQIITVVDTTPPVITPPASTTLSCALDPTTNAGTANATDNCFRSPTPAVNFTDAVTFTGSCPGIQTITRTFRAVDVCGNVGTAVQTIAQTASAAPNITIPDDVTVGCFDPVQSGNLGVATASFFCNVGVSINSQDSITNGTCPDQFTIQRTWTVKDVCNNTNSGVQVITVDDTEAPVIVVPDDQTIDCGEFPDFEVMAMDSCSTKLTITSDDDISGDSCLEDDQTIVRTWTVTDGCGNQATGEQTININKAPPPPPPPRPPPPPPRPSRRPPPPPPRPPPPPPPPSRRPPPPPPPSPPPPPPRPNPPPPPPRDRSPEISGASVSVLSPTAILFALLLVVLFF